ncbi:hypothetical protein [Acinetobacter venetianus]|uniref:Uncharacterized protein n=1 Tax=Acinetobacter venetianus TaxID=52133 RepID=A0A150HS42_9GAMM|nr:hypothetical protein [Acinetobacter venetianus]KXZ69126.1 hypothetical protein AVENLUH13518_02662 [Acinetobacter venetianus]
MKIPYKKIIMFSTILGIYYLFVFIRYERIPFPLDISMLPTLFLALGILSGLITIFIIFYALISSFVLLDPFEIGYSNIFYVNTKQLGGKNVAGIFNFFIFFFPPTIVLVITSIFTPDFAGAIAISSTIIFPALFSYYALSHEKNIKQDKLQTIRSGLYLRTFLTFMTLATCSLISFYLFITYLDLAFTDGSKTLIGSVLYMLGFYGFNFFVLKPFQQKDNFQRRADHYHGVNLKNTLLKIPAFYCYLFAIAFSLLPNVAHYTVSKSFLFLNIGGGIERIYFFSKKERMDLPNEIIDQCDKRVCYTKKLRVVMDLGSARYVKNSILGIENAVIALPTPNMYMVDPNAKESN